MLVRPGHAHLLEVAAVQAIGDLLDRSVLLFAEQTVLGREVGLTDAEILA